MTQTLTDGVNLLPDPEVRPVQYTLISVDDHLVEPRDMFDGRLPSKYAARAPRVVELPDGTEPWIYDGQLLAQNGTNAVVGQANRKLLDPTGFKDMRRGCWDVHERVRDMDINGVWASVNFPSIISGFCGTIFSRTKDAGLGLAVTKAWNDWMFEEWYGSYPERMVPMAITWLADPELGAQEIRRNAERGFVAVTLPERPHLLGYPSLYTRHWDPLLRACEETNTVICLHVGSSGIHHMLPDDAPKGIGTVLFPVGSMQACAEWVWSRVTLRFPGLKIVMAEGGIGWVPLLHDRFDYVMDHAGGPSNGAWAWDVKDMTPNEVLRRNFYFAILSDPSTLDRRHQIGIDHIMAEVDYPHADSTWPDSQEHFVKILGHLPVEDIRKITHENAAKLFHHPLPKKVLP